MGGGTVIRILPVTASAREKVISWPARSVDCLAEIEKHNNKRPALLDIMETRPSPECPPSHRSGEQAFTGSLGEGCNIIEYFSLSLSLSLYHKPS